MTSGKSKWDIKKYPFINRNLVALVMIPSIIGIHYGWVLLQKNEALVKKDERIELPIVTGAKLFWTKITSDEKDSNTK